MHEWKSIIIEVISSLGGSRVKLQDIYKQLEKHPIVTAYHKEPWKKGGQPRYQYWARRCLSTLVEEKRIKRVSTGTYSLS